MSIWCLGERGGGREPEDILCFLSCSSSQSGQQHFEAGESSTFPSQTAAHFIFEKRRLPPRTFHREALIARNKLELIFKRRPWLQISPGSDETSRQTRLSEDLLMQAELESSARAHIPQLRFHGKECIRIHLLPGFGSHT